MLALPILMAFQCPVLSRLERMLNLFGDTVTGSFVEIFSALRAEPETLFATERMHRRDQNHLFAEHRREVEMIARIKVQIVAELFRLDLDRGQFPFP
jgi:hypothetical protein